MPVYAISTRSMLLAGGVVCALGLHLWAALALAPPLDWGSTVGIVLAQVAAAMTCFMAATQHRGSTRLLWSLLCGCVGLQLVSTALDLRSQMLGTHTSIVPFWGILCTTMCYVPLLLAGSLRLDRDRQDVEDRLQIALCVLTAALFCVLVVSLLTSHVGSTPEDALYVARLFDVLNIYLATAFTVRWMIVEKQGQRRFFSVGATFLWLNTLMCFAHNRLLLLRDDIWLDVFVSAPYVMLVALILRRRTNWSQVPELSAPALRAMRNASSLVLCFGLILLGLAVSQRHFLLGAGSVLLAVASYVGVSLSTQRRVFEAEASLQAGNATLEQLVRIDGLTEVPNRRAFDERLLAECGKVARSGQPLSLLMIDIDHFKQLNDHLGHPAGDACLKLVAQSIRDSLPRTGDFVARYGGEEFAVLLPGTDQAGALQVARNLHAAVDRVELPHLTSPLRRVTISIGGGTSEAEAPTAAAVLVRAADGALYQAKILGRRRTEWAVRRVGSSSTSSRVPDPV